MSGDRLETARVRWRETIMPDRDHFEQDGSDELTSFRLNHLEQQMSDFMSRSEGWHNSLAAQITAMSNQIGVFQASLPEFYAPRREANERHAAINDRFEALERRIDDRRAVIDQKLTDLVKEVEQRFVALDKKVDQRFTDNVQSNTKRVERMEAAAWGFAVAILMALGTSLFALIKPA